MMQENFIKELESLVGEKEEYRNCKKAVNNMIEDMLKLDYPGYNLVQFLGRLELSLLPSKVDKDKIFPEYTLIKVYEIIEDYRRYSKEPIADPLTLDIKNRIEAEYILCINYIQEVQDKFPMAKVMMLENNSKRVREYFINEIMRLYKQLYSDIRTFRVKFLEECKDEYIKECYEHLYSTLEEYVFIIDKDISDTYDFKELIDNNVIKSSIVRKDVLNKIVDIIKNIRL